MMNLKQQSEYLAIAHSAEQLESALFVLQDARDMVYGARGQVDLESVQVVQEALHLRRVSERIEAALSESVDA